MNITPSVQKLIELSNNKILILDGAMGTQIMGRNLDEKDFRGDIFARHGRNLKGCNDVLSLTAPEVITDIHRAYLDAGADIIETNSFNCNVFSLADYGLGERVTELAMAAVRVARRAADEYTAATGRQVWVAGSMGPTSKSLTMETTEGRGDISMESLTSTYTDCAAALIAGGADLFIIETVFDTLNVKCAIAGARQAMADAGKELPVIISATLTHSGHLLSGMSLPGFIAATEHARPFALMLNCGFGAEGMEEPLEKLQKVPCLTGIYPNAGFPDELGHYNESAGSMASKLRRLLEEGKLNIVGGCCGTTPGHIRAIAQLASAYSPRRIPDFEKKLIVAGLEPMKEIPANAFIKVGERCNVAGSRKFLRLIKEGDIDAALEVARQQVDAGAQIIDINMDDALLDGREAMTSFLKALTADSFLARTPVMIDSADFSVIETSLRLLQGRSIVNSISLKEGEEKFREYASTIRRFGAIPIVMAFDEKGQATTTVRRLEIFTRAIGMLTAPEVGFREDEIILDPNILAVCTGIEGHDSLALEFIESIEAIKKLYPSVKVSGGVSNLSFAFRGNNEVREAMHAVFLHHAAARGLDMAIVNPSALPVIDAIQPALRKAVEDALIDNPSSEATRQLIAVATAINEQKALAKKPVSVISNTISEQTIITAPERLSESILKSDTKDLKSLIDECRKQGMTAMEIIDGPLMTGMNKVGELFGKGKLFLPQVVRSATAMKVAVTILQPYIEQEEIGAGKGKRRKIVLATVKGDVHDIGKNIVAVVMRCNGWDVLDLGVMVEPQRIIATAKDEKADAVGLSGLITPSLAEMAEVARMMQMERLTIPLCVGGATTSALHTALKIATLYDGPTVHTAEAASLPGILNALLSEQGEAVVKELKELQSNLRQEYMEREASKHLLPLKEARRRREKVVEPSPSPAKADAELELGVEEIAPYINLRAFIDAWELPVQSCRCGHSHGKESVEVTKLMADVGNKLSDLSRRAVKLRARVKILPAKGIDEKIFVERGSETIEIDVPRQLKLMPAGRPQLSLADFLTESGDYVGFFAVTTAGPIADEIDRLKADGNDYEALLLQSLADRLVEAATEVMHHRVRTDVWGYSPDEQFSPETFMERKFRGIRPAVGYPSLPDQRTIFLFDKVLDYRSLGISLTENGAMSPSASTTGMLFASPTARYFSVL